jgi:LysM repeat protein
VIRLHNLGSLGGVSFGPRPTLLAAAFVACVAALAPSPRAEAFPYVMKKGETLADIAARFYGKVELERVLVPANALDAEGPRSQIIAGMRVEIPATAHHVVAAGETWESLAEHYLGLKRRAEALALANGSMPWLPIDVGREIVIPYNLRYVVKRGDSTPSIAYRFLPKRDDAYVLDRYNELGGDPVEPGDVILVPIADLALTDEGKRAAKAGLDYVESEGEGDDRDAQDAALEDLPKLEAEVRSGTYVAAVARGSALLGSGHLTDPQIARIERQLLEAYVALDEEALAETACRAMRKADPEVVLDPVELSPKILKACTASMLKAPGPGER